MGQFAFSKSFNMLRDRQLAHAIRLIRFGIRLLGPLTPVSWLMRIGFETPGIPIARDLRKLLNWSFVQMDERIEVHASRRTKLQCKY